MRGVHTIFALAVLLGGFLVPTLSVQEAHAAKKQIVTLDMQDEPRTLDPQKAQDTIAFMILSHVMEGLTRLDPRNNVIPGMATEWEELSPTKYRFKLRKDATWSDGKPVTANDFVFAWRYGLEPKTASFYAFILFPLKNAEAINNGKKPVTELGVKALDDHTLEVELERPTAYFLRLTSFGSYFPAREDLQKKYGDKYAADADKLVYNGPWLLSEWRHNSSMKLIKNSAYWNAENIHIDEIRMPYLIRDLNSQFNMVKDGRYDMVRTLSKDLLPDAQRNNLQIRRYNHGTVWFLQFNATRKVTGNKWIRRAFNTAINRSEFVSTVVGIPGTEPIYGIVPAYMPAVDKTYGEEYPLTFPDGDLVKAKEYLAKGLKELGLEKMPPLSILINDDDQHKRDAEYFQSYFKRTLGVDLNIDIQTFKVRLEKTSNKDFDIVKSGWGPDYLDAMTFADLFTSWNTNNDSGWSSKEYDNLIRKAADSTDPKVRMESFHAAEKILVEEAPIVPLFQAYRVYVQSPRLVGVLRRTVAPDPDFYYARVIENVAKK